MRWHPYLRQLEVLNADNQPVSGLYAIGNCAGDIYAGWDYPINVQGNSHGRCPVEARLGEQLCARDLGRPTKARGACGYRKCVSAPRVWYARPEDRDVRAPRRSWARCLAWKSSAHGWRRQRPARRLKPIAAIASFARTDEPRSMSRSAGLGGAARDAGKPEEEVEPYERDRLYFAAMRGFKVGPAQTNGPQTKLKGRIRPVDEARMPCRQTNELEAEWRGQRIAPITPKRSRHRSQQG